MRCIINNIGWTEMETLNTKPSTGKKIVYIAINIIIALIIAFIFIKNYDIRILYNLKQNLIIFIISIIMVYIIKAIRLYLILYRTGIKKTEYIKTFCKVTPVSIILPLKIGEFFRIYCYGYLINNWIKSTVIILIDRFADTAALVTVMVFILFSGTHFTIFIYLLCLFLLFLLFLYKNFPNFYSFWKNYCLSEKATPGTLKALKYLEIANNLYTDIRSIIHGNGIILYVLSVLAWVIEIFNLIFITKSDSQHNIDNKISEYLLSTINLGNSIELRQFIIISIIICLTVYIIIKIAELIKKIRS